MIDTYRATRFCKDSISKIENYELAINDNENSWDCHHKLELTLDGEFAHTRDELKRLGMYFKRPYYELIFLPHKVHSSLHKKGKNHHNFGKKLCDKTKDKLKEKGKSRKHSEESKRKIGGRFKGCTWIVVDGKRKCIFKAVA